MLENFIGDTINIDKLFQEETEISSPSIDQLNKNAKKALGKRGSVAANIGTVSTDEKSKFVNSSLYTLSSNTEFKRLKELT
jgi:hypothetical protein